MYNIKQHKMELFDIESVLNHLLYLDYFDINSKCVGLLSPSQAKSKSPYSVEKVPCLARRISKHCGYNMVERSRRPFPPLSSTENVPSLACRGRSRETTG